ncbi:hypothetical protein BJ912DRAFT_974854 [Pholiota molesta]|nr:hypothetical protein BJ912DRAFT_974854 [Pholiota molesta]
MSNQIPPEIWLYISQFIPDDDLYRQLRTINSTFFHLAMALKYEEVFIIWSAASPTLPRMMIRLRDPFVSRKVKRVIVNFVCSPEAFVQRLPRPAFTTTKGRIIDTTYTWMSSARRFLPPSPFKSHNARALKAIVKCISTLPHTMAFAITTAYFDDGPCIARLANSPPPARNHLTWSSFAANLQSLTIRAELPTRTTVFQEMTAMKPYFQNLVALQILTIPATGAGHIDGYTSLTPFVRFVNAIRSPKFKKLSLTCLGYIHHPDIFIHFSKSLALDQLKLKMDVLPGAAQDTYEAGLKSFLCNGAHVLRELDLDIRTTYEDDMPDPILGKLLLDSARDRSCFSHLHSLRINPTAGSVGINILRTSIHRASSTLKTFVIYNIELSQEDALIVLDALSKCAKLTYLRMQIVLLDITIVDSMAANLPGLKQLHVWHNRDAMPIESLMPPSFRYAGTFREQSYPHWKLEDISVYFDRREIADTAMMEIFAHSVPAIKSFCGREIGRQDEYAG